MTQSTPLTIALREESDQPGCALNILLRPQAQRGYGQSE